MGEYFVPTKSCPTGSSYEVVEFNSKVKKKDTLNSDASEKERVEEIIMKKARFEIYKFAQSGLPNAERQKSQFDLALKLGAVPRKNKAINYKILKGEKQALKKADSERIANQDRSMKQKKSRRIKDPKSKLRRKRKVGSGILKSYGKVRKS